MCSHLRRDPIAVNISRKGSETKMMWNITKDKLGRIEHDECLNPRVLM